MTCTRSSSQPIIGGSCAAPGSFRAVLCSVPPRKSSFRQPSALTGNPKARKQQFHFAVACIPGDCLWFHMSSVDREGVIRAD